MPPADHRRRQLGLGKTLEVIALVMLNQRQAENFVPTVTRDNMLEMDVTEVPVRYHSYIIR